MVLFKSNNILIFVVLFVFTLGAYAQSYNKDVEAKLLIEKENGLINITGTALNKTKTTQELSYKLSVFKTDPNQNQSKNQQAGRFALNSNENKQLSTTSVNFDDTSITGVVIVFVVSELIVVCDVLSGSVGVIVVVIGSIDEDRIEEVSCSSVEVVCCAVVVAIEV